MQKWIGYGDNHTKRAPLIKILIVPLHSLINHLLNPTQAKSKKILTKESYCTPALLKKQRGLLCYSSHPFYFFLKPKRNNSPFSALFLAKKNKAFYPSSNAKNKRKPSLCSFFGSRKWPTFPYLLFFPSYYQENQPWSNKIHGFYSHLSGKRQAAGLESWQSVVLEKATSKWVTE